MFLVDLRDLGIDGAKVDIIMELSSISVNRNTVPSDKSAFHPSGIRVGTPALTSRNFREADMEKVAELMDHCIQLTLDIENMSGKKMIAS